MAASQPRQLSHLLEAVAVAAEDGAPSTIRKTSSISYMHTPIPMLPAAEAGAEVVPREKTQSRHGVICAALLSTKKTQTSIPLSSHLSRRLPSARTTIHPQPAMSSSELTRASSVSHQRACQRNTHLQHIGEMSISFIESAAVELRARLYVCVRRWGGGGTIMLCGGKREWEVVWSDSVTMEGIRRWELKWKIYWPQWIFWPRGVAAPAHVA